MNAPEPKVPGRAGAQHSWTYLCVSLDSVTRGAAMRKVSCSPLSIMMVQSLRHARHLCTIWVATTLKHIRFPLCSSLLSLLPSQTTRTTCFAHTSALFISQSPWREKGVIQCPSQHRSVLQAEPLPPSMQCIAARC